MDSIKSKFTVVILIIGNKKTAIDRNNSYLINFIP